MTAGKSETHFAALLGEWTALLGHAAEESAADRDSRFRLVSNEYRELVANGDWVSGPSDLVTILGRDRDELLHSSLLAWLLTPTAQHRLGDAFLRLLIGRIWPEYTDVPLQGASADREVDRVVVDPDNSQTYQARADVVVRTPELTIIIENKLDAVEGPIQCERLYRVWRGEPTQTRWLLVSPSGRAPVSIVTEEAAQAWTAVSYRDVSAWLSESIGRAEPSSSLGRASALQYLATLRRKYPAVPYLEGQGG